METDKKKNPHAGHRKRMRERYNQNGFTGWADHEVLEFILFDKIPRRDTNKIAHDIIDKFGSMENVLAASPEQLMQIKGIGAETAKYICNQEKIYNFCRTRKKSDVGRVYKSNKPEEHFSGLFSDMNRECFYMLCLDGKDRIIKSSLIFEGTFESINLDVGSLIRIAVTADARSVVLAHNHPSGILVPSDSDIVATKVIIKAMEFVGVKVTGHVIVTEDGCIDILKTQQFTGKG